MEGAVWLDAAHHGVGLVVVHGIQHAPQVALTEIDPSAYVRARPGEALQQRGNGLDSKL
jgi:hypothetical protein